MPTHNILLITCDQWRGDCLSAAGHATVKTPNADTLAGEGVLFRRHYAGAAPCSPARACLYTGLYQMNNRVCGNGTPLDRRHDNIALAARRLGYEPTLFGYTDIAPDPRFLSPGDPALRSYEGVLPGFAVRLLLPEHHRPWLSWLAAQGVDHTGGYPAVHRAQAGGQAEISAPPRYSKDQTPAAFLAGEFVRWLSEQDEGWFAHVSFISPHPPFAVPPPFNEMYDAPSGPPFSRLADWRLEAARHPWLARQLDSLEISDFLPGSTGLVRDLSEADFRRIRAIYYGMISEVDGQIGRIFSALRERRSWDRTTIVLTSDHAELMGDHFLLGKGGFFEGSFHIPLIIREPRLAAGAGSSVDRFTEAVDVMPTLLDLMGHDPLPHLDGLSLKPFLEGREVPAWRSAAHWEFDFRPLGAPGAGDRLSLPPRLCNLAVVRSERFKYVHFGGLPPLLFDLANDPGELHDLAGDPDLGPTRLELAEQLLRWRAEHLDQSLALAALTPDGLAGSAAALPRSH